MKVLKSVFEIDENRESAQGKEKAQSVLKDFSLEYRTRAIITRSLYTFYPLFEVHLCTVTFGLMYGL